MFRDFPTFSRICIFFLLTLSLLIFSCNLPLLSASALLCFSSVHIVGSLTSKLPSNIHINGIYPECFTLANIAALFKKGDATQMKNYRPLALHQVFSKILARLVRNRFQCAYDSWIQNSPFGFRPKKSTSQAIFVARRLLDIAERQQSNMMLVLLDWEKAFDKINQSKRSPFLRRLKTPPNMLRLVTRMHAHHPKFRITTEGISSRYRRQESGIRQGCPLSPFLFILLMGALFQDLKSKFNTPRQLEPIKGIRYAEVLYADDQRKFRVRNFRVTDF